ncbi:MAG: hypothetical protein PVF91_04810 [Chromatiales bacterium]|jgi:hypothetical protein
MAGESEDKPLGSSESLGPAQDFAAFCEEERERRRNSGEAFDEEGFDEAVDLVLRKLSALAEEGA